MTRLSAEVAAEQAVAPEGGGFDSTRGLLPSSGGSNNGEDDGGGEALEGDNDEDTAGEADEDGDRNGDHGEPGPSGEEEDEWEEMYACPLSIRFTQDKIHPFFYRRGPIVNVVPKIRVVSKTRDPLSVLELVPPFAAIQCLRKDNELWSLDNRRLYALQLAAMEQWPQQCEVRLLWRGRLPRHKFKTQYRKFRTTSEGRAITVCARYQQFDSWSWLDRAVELEQYTFTQRLSTLLSVFEVVPALGALLFRSGLTGFSSRTPWIVSFILTLAVDLLRQKVPALERRVCELHVRAVMDGDVKLLSPCWRRLWPVRQSGDCCDGEEEPVLTSGPQLAAMFALVLMSLLPYVLGVGAKLRSSLLSCWLGVACVIVVQLGTSMRSGGFDSERSGGAGQQLTPKHRG